MLESFQASFTWQDENLRKIQDSKHHLHNCSHFLQLSRNFSCSFGEFYYYICWKYASTQQMVLVNCFTDACKLMLALSCKELVLSTFEH